MGCAHAGRDDLPLSDGGGRMSRINLAARERVSHHSHIYLEITARPWGLPVLRRRSYLDHEEASHYSNEREGGRKKKKEDQNGLRSLEGPRRRRPVVAAVTSNSFEPGPSRRRSAPGQQGAGKI
jgi:hypothetical protein